MLRKYYKPQTEINVNEMDLEKVYNFQQMNFNIINLNFPKYRPYDQKRGNQNYVPSTLQKQEQIQSQRNNINEQYDISRNLVVQQQNQNSIKGSQSNRIHHKSGRITFKQTYLKSEPNQQNQQNLIQNTLSQGVVSKQIRQDYQMALIENKDLEVGFHQSPRQQHIQQRIHQSDNQNINKHHDKQQKNQYNEHLNKNQQSDNLQKNQQSNKQFKNQQNDKNSKNKQPDNQYQVQKQDHQPINQKQRHLIVSNQSKFLQKIQPQNHLQKNLQIDNLQKNQQNDLQKNQKYDNLNINQQSDNYFENYQSDNQSQIEQQILQYKNQLYDHLNKNQELANQYQNQQFDNQFKNQQYDRNMKSATLLKYQSHDNLPRPSEIMDPQNEISKGKGGRNFYKIKSVEQIYKSKSQNNSESMADRMNIHYNHEKYKLLFPEKSEIVVPKTAQQDSYALEKKYQAIKQIREDVEDDNLSENQDGIHQTLVQTKYQPCSHCMQQQDQELIQLNCNHNYHSYCLFEIISISVRTGNPLFFCKCLKKIPQKQVLNILKNNKQIQDNLFKNQLKSLIKTFSENTKNTNIVYDQNPQIIVKQGINVKR